MLGILVAILLVIGLLFVGITVLSLGLKLLWLFLTGLVIGALARLLIPGKQDMGWFKTALFGVAGSLVGGILASALFDWGWLGQFIAGVAVAAALIALLAGTTREPG